MIMLHVSTPNAGLLQISLSLFLRAYSSCRTSADLSLCLFTCVLLMQNFCRSLSFSLFLRAHSSSRTSADLSLFTCVLLMQKFCRSLSLFANRKPRFFVPFIHTATGHWSQYQNFGLPIFHSSLIFLKRLHYLTRIFQLLNGLSRDFVIRRCGRLTPGV